MTHDKRRTHELRARLHHELQRSDLLDPNRTVLVAVSGGIDSVCLLHLLNFSEPRPNLVAAHFDHRMRADSGADADWVRGLCRAWSVPHAHARASAPPRSEADARAQRYHFLAGVAVEQGADLIVTGHHADDQAETVLFRLARGTGLLGLTGIAARRGNIVRPLLRVTRADLHAYARAIGLSWREDPTNRDIRYARNRIRLQVLPALEAAQPGAARRIAALAGRAADAEAAWNVVVRQALQDVVSDRDESTLTLARDRLLVYHPHVRARVMRHLLRQLGSRPGRAGTIIALQFIASGASGTGVEMAGGVVLSREFDRLLLRRPGAQAEAALASLTIPSAEAGTGSVGVAGRQFVARWEPCDVGTTSAPGGMAALLPDDAGWTAFFDPAALRFPLELRGWRPGDRIRLRYGSKKLKELFRERRIGRTARAQVPVLLDAGGRVLWIVGVARAHDAPLPADGHVFRISVADGDTS